MADAFIVDAVRSPIGKKNGTLSAIRGDELTAQILNGLLARHDLDPAEVEDVQTGCVTQIGEQGWNVGRIATMAAGWPVPTVPSPSGGCWSTSSAVVPRRGAQPRRSEPPDRSEAGSSRGAAGGSTPNGPRGRRCARHVAVFPMRARGGGASGVAA